MGCTDEKSVSNRPLKKINRNISSLNNNYNNNKNDKDLKNPEKINSSKEEDKKDLSKHKETEQEQNTIKLLNELEYDNKNKEPKKEENKNNRNEDSNNEVEKNDSEDSEKEEEEKEEERDDDKEEEEEEEEEYENEEESNREMIRQLTPYLQAKVNPNFNFPEVKGNVYVGKGLRRMKGYTSIVPKEELEKRRIAFWGTRVEGDPQVWNFLNELCNLPEEEDENLKAMLEANEITPLKKCINVTYDKAGEVYEIPNYCINEPVSYDLPEMHIKKPMKKNVSFHVRKGAQQIKIKAANTTQVEKLKSNIGKKLGINENNVRLFFRGKELKNGNELWVYNIEDDCVVMIMCTG